MARFLDRLDLLLMGRKKWMTHTQLRYESDVAKRTIVVPAELVTNLASVPRLPLAYMLAGERAPGPAVVHDYLYLRPDWGNRALADAVFLEAMAVDQPELGFEAELAPVRGLMWSAVRSFGWIPWRNHGKRNAALNPIWDREGWPEVQTP